MDYKYIKIERERDGKVAKLTLNRPEKVSVLSEAFSREIMVGLLEIANDIKRRSF